MYKQFKCCIIGQTNLTLQCAEILYQTGHQIKAIITSYAALRKWARKNYIDCSDSLTLLSSQSSYDFLFSIVNDIILPIGVLKNVQRFAINFHDSLLPRYAGVHATSWAILNEETKHGVTWHVMQKSIDSGEILKQAAIMIEPDETAFSLNISCYEKAKKLFAQLLTELASKTYSLIPQSLSQRTYYSRHHKPPGNGLINWMKPAHAIDCLVRALQFGNQINSLSSAKLLLFGKVYLVKNLIITSQYSTAPPGSLLDFTVKHCRIATKTYDVLVTELQNDHGQLCEISELYLHFLKEKRKKFSIQPDISLMKILYNKSTTFVQHELFWLGQLNQAQPFPLPFLPMARPSLYFSPQRQKLVSEITIPIYLLKALNITYPGIEIKMILFSALIIYFYRTLQKNTVSIGISYPKIREEIKNLELFFSNNLPFTITLKDDSNFEQLLIRVIKKFKELNQRGTFLIDILARYPKLKSTNFDLPLIINFSDGYPKKSYITSGYINIFICDKKNKIFICTNPSALNYSLKKLLLNLKVNLVSLVKDIAANPAKAIGFICIMNNNELAKILYKWNDTKSNYLQEKTVQEVFAEQVQKTPDKVCIIHQEQELTYQDINKKSNTLAYYLQQYGVGIETCVGICAERGSSAIIALLAILKAGGTYVPISPDYPTERIKFILRDSNCKILLTYRHIRNKLSNNINTKIIIFNNSLLTFNNDLQNKMSNKLNLNKTAYIMYTSGSTGKPKGVKISHYSIINLAKNTNFIHIKKTDNIAHLVNIYFDPSTLEIWGALLNGATLTIFKKYDLFNLHYFLKNLNEKKVNIAVFITSLFKQAAVAQVPLNFLKYLIVGGETLEIETVRNFFQLKKMPKKFLNAYGPTENTTVTTYYEIKKNPSHYSSIPIGKPISNTQVYVLDKNLQPLPIGYAGELLIGGDGLAKGYLNQPALTHAKFIKNPFSTNPKDRLYKTGDLARWLPDGNLEYLGRMDDQVKIRGFRISLGEIEHILLNHPTVNQATVLVVSTPTKQSQLLAFIVAANNSSSKEGNALINVTELKSFLAQSLPDYMVPNAYVVLDAFPLTHNGKIDKNKLLTYSREQMLITEDYNPPTTPVEKQLTLLWQNVLRIERISITDDFFSLGGDSILAMQLIARANSKFNLSFTVKDLIQFPTIAGLAGTVSFHEAYFPLAFENLSGDVPLTPIQRWFFTQGFKNPEQWSQVCLVNVSDLIEIDYLIPAINYCLKQHDALYLRFQRIASGWQQHYTDAFESTVIFLTVPLLVSCANNFTEIGQLLQEQFNLTEGPLAGIAILVDEFSKKPIKILFAIHHLLVDGVSWRILLTELANIYPYFAGQQTPPRIHGVISFSRWSNKLKQLAEQDFFLAEKARWLQTERLIKPLPQDFTRPNLASASAYLELSLDADITSALSGQIHTVYRTHINDVLLAALLRTICDWTQKRTLVLDLESHGRCDDILELNSINTVGWFTSLFPVALTLNDRQWEKLLPDMKRQLKSIPNQGLGYGTLRYLCTDQIKDTQRISQIKPQIAFNYWGKLADPFEEEPSFSWDHIKLLSGPGNALTHLITVDGVIQDGQFVIRWTYSQNHYAPATIANLARSFREALIEVVQHCLNSSATAYHTADFPLVNLSEQQLNHLVRAQAGSGIQNIYPLTPAQQGLIFEQWRNPAAPYYQVQAHWQLRGELDLFILRRAFENLFDRHEVLRSHFSWRYSAAPIQIIQHEVALPWRVHDLRPLNYAEQQIRLAELIDRDRKNILNIEIAPLAHITVILMADDHYEIICHFHHAILDGWSFSILLQDLHDYYTAEHHHKTRVLSPAPAFSDYIQWLQRQDWQTAKTFWREHLNGFVQPVDLGALGIRAAAKDNAANINMEFSSIQFSADLSQSLRDFSKLHGIRLNTLFQGVWGILLHRYTQAADIVFGATVSGRAANLENMDVRVGLFINTLPLRLIFSPGLTVLRFLMQLQHQMMTLLPFDHTPLSYIQEWTNFLGPEKFLFDSMVVFENYPQATTSAAQDICVSKKLEFWDPTHYALTLAVMPDACIQLKIGFDTQRIDSMQVQRLLVQLQRLARLIIHYATLPIDELPLLSLSEYRQYIAPQNTRIDSLPLTTIMQAFEQQVIDHPEQPALVFEDVMLSYRQLNRQANQLAHYISHQGAGINSNVAVLLTRSPELIISLLAIWKAGAVYLPLDYTYPLQRIKSILMQAPAAIFITREALLSEQSRTELKQGSATPAFFILWDQITTELAKQPTINLSNVTKLNHLAYILHTSGTTGVPKSIAHEHKTLTNLIKWQTNASHQTYSINRNISQLATMSFDVFLQEVCYTLSNAYTLHIVPTRTKQSLTELVNFIHHHQIHQMFLPTGLLEPLCESALYLKISLDNLTDIMVAGEELKISSCIRSFFLSYPKIRLTNQYGPTETHVASAYTFSGQDIEHWPTFPPIGAAIDQMQLYILDKNAQPMPAEVPGELYIAGMGLARGYVNHPDQTNERFISATFSAPPQEDELVQDLASDIPMSKMFADKFSLRLYRTGDKAKQHLNGQFEYLGRLDKQVKIRGFRVELAEIETQILRLPGIRQCVVTTVPDAGNTLQLICYLVPNSDFTLDKLATGAELNQALAKILPDYMLPSYFHWLEQIPLTRNGKVDKKALPQWSEKMAQAHSIIPNQLSTDIYTKQLAELWGKILQVTPTDDNQNFFTLGGHSLSALRLLLEIEKHFAVKLFVSDLLHAPTLGQLSLTLQQQRNNQLLTPFQTIEFLGQRLPFCVFPLQPVGDKTPLFLVHPIGGTVFWFVHLARLLDKERPVYGIGDPSVIQQGSPLFSTMEELAAFYVHCIRTIQPKGPYLLAGSSFGATCAFEMARQLMARGESIHFLGLLDGWAFYPAELKDEEKFKQLMRIQIQDLKQRFQINQVDNVDFWVNLQWQRSQLLWNYALKPLNTQLTLFKAEEAQPDAVWPSQNDNGWSAFSDLPVTICPVPGNHETMFYPPQVNFLAQSINKKLLS